MTRRCIRCDARMEAWEHGLCAKCRQSVQHGRRGAVAAAELRREVKAPAVDPRARVIAAAIAVAEAPRDWGRIDRLRGAIADMDEAKARGVA